MSDRSPLRLINNEGQNFDAPRESLCVNRVAQLLDCDQSFVRKLIRRGQLQAYKVGRRGVRVFCDSVRAYQEGNIIESAVCGQGRRPAVKKPAWRSAPHREAMSFLQQNGVL